MAAKQKSKFAILGLLSWKPMSGYDIKKLVDIGLSHFWQENYGHIYPTLESLVQEAFATRKDDRSTGRRKRSVYTITRKGQRAFQQWLAEPAAAPEVRNELQLKFFLSCNLPSNEIVRLIKEYEAQQHKVLEEYRASENVLRQAIGDDVYAGKLKEILDVTHGKSSRQSRSRQCTVFLLTLRHGIRAVEARLAWCAEVLEMLDT